MTIIGTNTSNDAAVLKLDDHCITTSTCDLKVTHLALRNVSKKYKIQCIMTNANDVVLAINNFKCLKFAWYELQMS